MLSLPIPVALSIALVVLGATWRGPTLHSLVPSHLNQTAVLRPLQDAYVDINEPNMAFGSSARQDQLVVGSSCLGSAHLPSNVAYLQFADFDRTASRFSINLAVLAAAAPRSSVPVFLIPVPNRGMGFNESTLTWNNQGDQTGFTVAGRTTDDLESQAVATALSSDPGKLIGFASAELDQILQTSDGSVIFALATTCRDGDFVAHFIFGSKDNPSDELRPSLTIG
jgi:hypothetical protein